MHTTTLPDMAARSSAVTLGYWIGHLALLAGSALTCCLGALSKWQAADGVSSRMTSSFELYLCMVGLIAIMLFFISGK